MGCGASRSAPVAAALSLIPRVEKDRDDGSLEQVQLKRLGVPAYDDFFTEFESAVNVAVNLNNDLHDSIWDAKAALAYASSPDPEYALDLEVETNGIRSVPQLLLDVLYAESNSRPLPFEVRHLLTSRPAIAEADGAVGEAVQALTAALQSHPAPAQLSYDDSKKQLTVNPVSTGPSVPGAARQYQKLHQHAARVSAALADMRKAAPGLRLLVTVVPSPAPGARTFAWRLLARPDVAEGNLAAQGVQSSATAGPAAAADGDAAAAARRLATPLRVASAHGAASIVEAAATVAQQAAAIAAAVNSTAVPLVQLQLEAGRRLTTVTPPEGFTAVAASAASTTHRSKGSALVLRSLTLNRGEPPGSDGGGAAAGAGAGKGGIAADARADEAAAVLRRAISSANHALFRLSKYGTAGASSGRDAAALRKGDPSAYPLSRALTLVLEAAIRAARQAAGLGRGSDDGGDCGFGGAMSVSELLSVEPQLHEASEPNSVQCGGGGGGGGGPCSPREGGGGGGRGGGADGPPTGPGWSFEWGIQPHVAGVCFPDCLPPKARAVYDAVNAAVNAALNVTEQLSRVQREVVAAVDQAETVFGKYDDQLVAAARDLMSAGRMRAALDRNANTISASPALVGLLRTAVVRLMDELRRGAGAMRELAAGDPDAEARESLSPRGSGNRSMMARQLDKAAAVAAAAVAAAAAAAEADEEEEEYGSADGRSEATSASAFGSELGGGGGDGNFDGDSADGGGDRGRRRDGGDRASAGQASGYGNRYRGVKRTSGAGAGTSGTGADARVGRGGYKPPPGTGYVRAKAVSRRVLLPPLSPGL